MYKKQLDFVVHNDRCQVALTSIFQLLHTVFELVNVIIWLWCIKSLMHWETLSTSTVCVCVRFVCFTSHLWSECCLPGWLPLLYATEWHSAIWRNLKQKLWTYLLFLFVCYLFIYIFSACSKFSLFSRSQFFSFVYTYSAITYGYLAI